MKSMKGGRHAVGVRTEWLEAFLQTARHRSYSEAARRLGRDQSIVSRHVQHLEDWLGKSLLTDEVTLTPEGEEFRPKADEICRLLQESRAAPQPEPARKVWTRRISAKKTNDQQVSPSPRPPKSAAHVDMSFWTNRPRKR